MIPALTKFKDIQFLVASTAAAKANESKEKNVLLPPFAPQTLNFLADLSEQLLQHGATDKHPEIISLGFWLRASNLKKLQAQCPSLPNTLLKPLGRVLHIAPSNVDIQFFYSWVLSLLLGNSNIVRISQVESALKDRLLQQLQILLAKPEHQHIAQHNAFVSWPHDDAITADISKQVDARMLWGSDESVAHIRRLPARISCRDIVFVDKFSVSVVDLNGVENFDTFAEALSRDISAFAQRACSSPRVIFSCSSDETIPQQLVAKLSEAGQKNTFSPSRAVNHLVTQQLLTAKDVLLESVAQSHIQILKLQEFSPEMLQWHVGESQLFWVQLQSIEQLVEFIDEKCQTISYFGVERERLLNIVENLPIQAIDRVVPVGRALEFDVIWDGYDLFSQLSRRVSVF